MNNVVVVVVVAVAVAVAVGLPFFVSSLAQAAEINTRAREITTRALCRLTVPLITYITTKHATDIDRGERERASVSRRKPGC